MQEKPWFTIDSQYTPNGIDVTFFNEKVNLTPKDICYLMCEIDVFVTRLRVPLVEIIPLGFYGHYFEVTYIQWLQFIGVFSSAIIQDGWNSDSCQPQKKWIAELIQNKQR